MSGKRYPEEFKIEAVKQVVDRGYSVASVATRLDITTHSLYAWIKKYGPDSSTNKEQSDAQAEIRRLQKVNPSSCITGKSKCALSKNTGGYRHLIGLTKLFVLCHNTHLLSFNCLLNIQNCCAAFSESDQEMLLITL